MASKQQNISFCKRKELDDITNTYDKSKRSNVNELLPNLDDSKMSVTEQQDYVGNDQSVLCELERNYENVHPLLGWYKHDLQTEHLSYDQFQQLMSKEKEEELLNFLVSVNLIAKERPCILCGGFMKRKKDGKHFFWICNRRLNGVKCNKAKKSIRDGTIFDNSNLSTQTILTIIWHFVHHLDERQCANYTNISQKDNKTVIKWYKFCREVVTEWFWDPVNTPKLGGFGKIVEMDESYFPGKPKFNRGRRLGEDTKNSWEDDEKWVFGLIERESLDAIAIQVPSNRSRKDLLPHIRNHCLPGSIFCSDGWNAYNKLIDHLDIEDTLHFPVNHSENYVDPNTGAHTQTIEGVWRQCKAFLPTFGLKPRYLHLYIGSFLWHRYCKQRKLDMFTHILKCISEKRPFTRTVLPSAQMVTSVSCDISCTKQGLSKENAIDLMEDDDFES